MIPIRGNNNRSGEGSNGNRGGGGSYELSGNKFKVDTSQAVVNDEETTATQSKWTPARGHVLNCDNNYKVDDESQTMKVWTQTAKQITDQILPVPRMIFKTTGWEGFTKKNSKTGYTTRIPVTWDQDDYLWYIYFTMGETKASAMRLTLRVNLIYE